MSLTIPAPPSVPFLGNIGTIDKEVPLNSFMLLAKQYGEIVQLNFVGNKVVILNSYDLVNEVSDEKRFYKKVSRGLLQVRNAVGDALFTAHAPGEQNWYLAHRILMPAFSTLSVRSMFDDMYDITSQMILKWERFGPTYSIDPAADFTRLTLDAISLCAMSYRLNSFYREELHPFAQAMVDFLIECGNRSFRPALVRPLMRGTNAKYEADQQVMMNLVDEILEYRKTHPTDKKDLLTLMLTGKDKETGLGLPEDNIKRNLLTFLIAGHETTSGLLTFMVYYLLKHPEAMRKLREEVDTMIGDRPMTIDDIHKLPYLIAVMRETLRLSPTAPVRGAAPIEDTTLKNGSYFVEKDSGILVNVTMSQRDPKIWGADAEQFRPERMLDGKFEALPPNAWQPFGFGMRACIGRPFAWQEAQLVLATIIQRFDLVMEDPSYSLHIKQTLTVKPQDFHIHAIPRAGKPKLLAMPSSTLKQANEKVDVSTQDATDVGGKKPLYVLYGSNTGSCESFAQRVASDAAAHGFKATIGTLDSATGHIPTEGPVIIITASFEGQPADNAAHFVEWLSALKGTELANVAFSVFGCGNRDWVATYQRIPKLIDQALEERGAKRIFQRGEGDAGNSDFFESFDKWEAGLWTTLSEVYNTQADQAVAGIKLKTVDTGATRATILRQIDTNFGTVVENKVLTAPGAPVKRHIEFELPEGSSYRVGDYLAILPVNPARDVQRVIAHFGLSAEQEIVLTSNGPTSLPVGKPITISSLLNGYVELSQPATTRDLRTLASAKNSETSLKVLQELSASYVDKVVAKRLSVLDIIEDCPDIKISFEDFLQLLPAMRIRQYSISSSPLANPQHVTLTISVIVAPPISGRTEPFLGVASTYLAGLRKGDKVQMAIRASNAAFHPPDDPTTPIVMICAGSGLAPMRGFLQERAMQKQAGREVAKSILFFGCRNPKEDYLYSDTDLKEWAELGVVDIRPAFSRASSESGGCKYVQDRIWQDRADIRSAFKEKNAQFYLCGASRVSQSVKEKVITMIQEGQGVDAAQATSIYGKLIVGRFATDVFE